MAARAVAAELKKSDAESQSTSHPEMIDGNWGRSCYSEGIPISGSRSEN